MFFLYLVQEINKHVHGLVDKLVNRFVTGEVLHAAADVYMEDYVKNRLPPVGSSDVGDEMSTLHVPQRYIYYTCNI